MADKKGNGKKPAKLINDETFVFLGNQTKEDYNITARIEIEKHITEFRYEHSERFNNWQTDELYIEQANIAEAAFLNKIHDGEMGNVLARHSEDASSQKAIFEDQRTFNAIVNEMKSLTIQVAQNKAAAERMKRAKAVLKERRGAVRQHLARIEARQEFERKSLSESHKRSLKQRKLVRGVVIRDVEDPEIRIIVSGQDFNQRTMAEENAKTNATKAEADKKFHAQVLAQLVVDTKEIEQMREEHLVHHKYATRYCERELEIIDENEAILFEHTAKEQKLEASQKAQVDYEEDRISTMIATALAHEAEHRVKAAAAAVRESQRKEARRLKKQQQLEAVQRENEFWQQEEIHLMAHLAEKNLESQFEALKKEFLNRRSNNTSDFSGINDEDDEEDTRLTNDDNNIEATRARELALLEGLKKEHRQALKRMKAVHLKIREQNRAEQQKSLKAILTARDDDIASLKAQQAKEMSDIKTSQAANRSDEDSKNTTDKMFALLPKNVSETLKSGKAFTPKKFENLTFLTADIVNLQSIAQRSSPQQLLNLVNRVYTAFDECIDANDEIYKFESDSDSYCLVTGVSSESKDPKVSAANLVSLGLTFCRAVKEVDVADQIVDTIQIRVGIHSGSAFGGVPNPAFPKFSLLGDASTVSSVLEQTSRPNAVHISGATHELVKDKFEFDVSESLLFKGHRISTFWALENINEGKNKRRGKGSRTAAQ